MPDIPVLKTSNCKPNRLEENIFFSFIIHIKNQNRNNYTCLDARETKLKKGSISLA